MKTLLLFPSTRTVIRAESLCKEIGAAVQIVTTPKDITSECGMSIEIDEADEPRVAAALSEAGIPNRIHRRKKPVFDLLTTVEYGGCSAKLAPDKLAEALKALPVVTHPDLLVDISTHDDAGVFRITDDIALIQTVDFFPPICSDPYEFGQIAAANALSDVFAMGGTALNAMNIVMFPPNIPLEVLQDILRGGMERCAAAGAVMVGGHTIADSPPKYGLAVTGIVHPARVVTNAGARPGERLILTKPIGTGILTAGRKIGSAAEADYQAALDSMKQLNREGATVMQTHGIRCATDITGFSLLGHARGIARASRVTLAFESERVPLLDGAARLVGMGCIPGACFRNQGAIEADCRFGAGVSYDRKMLLFDAQTSGGLLMSVPPDRVEVVLDDLHRSGYPRSAVIGEVRPLGPSSLEID